MSYAWFANVVAGCTIQLGGPHAARGPRIGYPCRMPSWRMWKRVKHWEVIVCWLLGTGVIMNWNWTTKSRGEVCWLVTLSEVGVYYGNEICQVGCPVLFFLNASVLLIRFYCMNCIIML
jgi:hypothetical protein